MDTRGFVITVRATGQHQREKGDRQDAGHACHSHFRFSPLGLLGTTPPQIANDSHNEEKGGGGSEKVSV
jgi:hypothetical protein